MLSSLREIRKNLLLGASWMGERGSTQSMMGGYTIASFPRLSGLTNALMSSRHNSPSSVDSWLGLCHGTAEGGTE